MSKIFVYDEFSPQDTAMLQALYSRSASSVEEHVNKVKETGSGKFMERFYVGYGHSSIADCGSTTLFIEGISILADKAIQDWQLYSGQETSTRYIDMSKQPIVDPLMTEDSREILDAWMDFYISSQEAVQNHLKEKYPKREEEEEGMYEKAIKARTFDILRGFLPAGITTQLSWHTNLRQAWDKLSLLRHHPVEEVSTLAEEILLKLKGKYAHSFSHELYPDQEKYRKYSMQSYNYFDPENHPAFRAYTNIENRELQKYKDIIFWRPVKTNLPTFLSELGNVTFEFLMDFGSFRDIQRHRNGVCRMPLLTTKFGFNSWYLKQLPDSLRAKAEELIERQAERINKMDLEPKYLQYYIALGFNVPCKVSYGLPAAVYVVELRSGKAVHPTLRRIAHQMNQSLLEMFPGITLHSDLDQDDWDARRGLQDITEKK
ncbi:MAG: FAD-dependent thymidylate synthase [Parcubacteria group bacterium]|jgi:thymidylate synthase ThyX